jgi:hypothetical protein
MMNEVITINQEKLNVSQGYADAHSSGLDRDWNLFIVTRVTRITLFTVMKIHPVFKPG